MTIDQYLAELTQAAAGLPGDTEVNFKVIAAKAAGQEFATVNTIKGFGAINTVYPDPGSSIAAHIDVEFA